ncbi:hypothetical protein DL765_009250 [Monosporascus sp. GIB2]|nr:hypothetical protein DL765_009250 [Monosporascus sp. GIB2]
MLLGQFKPGPKGPATPPLASFRRPRPVNCGSGSWRRAPHRVVRSRAAGRHYSAKELLQVVGVPRDTAALESLEGFDERIVLRALVQETDSSKAGRE